MSADARARANAAQRVASDPAVSAFVSASAGSGKTKLLTDRLLRLMLARADPARIQCLTFTKAAAAEMAIRLNRRLGEWVTCDDTRLDAELAALDVAATEENRKAARELFARVLDLPGGMRIGTIHAFCQSVLRRFPLEAALSPHFRVMDDTDSELALAESRESMLAGSHTADRRACLTMLAGLVNVDGFGELVKALQIDRSRLSAVLAAPDSLLMEAQRRALGIADRDDAAVMARAVATIDEPMLRGTLRAVAERGAPSLRERALRLLDWLSLSAADRAEHWAQWRHGWLAVTGEPRTASNLLNKKLTDQSPELLVVLLDEQARVAAIEDDRQAVRVAALSASLMALASPVVHAYCDAKDASGLLDYADLIDRSGRLLVDPGAAWVLYKLDGGLDHLLLDEVQDTAPAQWEIAGAMTAEFFSGMGAHDSNGAPLRTVFAVGDPKQSIFSFQGADPGAFAQWRGRLANGVGESGLAWRDVSLDVSFRSAAPVLALVDAVFAEPDAARGVAGSEPLCHLTDRAGQAGSVELWPLAPVPEIPLPEPWSIPDRNRDTTDSAQLLAAALADWIARNIGSLALPSRGRTLAPGDVLVLVRSRNRFARALIRALKSRHVPVAGLDRIVLTEQPAVADLLALCDTLLQPDDDLSLACVLTSPLGGLADDDLIALAPGRRDTLWEALRTRHAERAGWAEAWAFLSALFGRADHVSPHALLSEALGPLGGRARLLGRLGPEAAEPLDELLNKALDYAGANPPSLQGFVHWLRRSAAEVKRQAEGAGDAVRVMTVHGAKGLQAPLVILPDTTGKPPDDGPLLWAPDPGSNAGLQVPLWTPNAKLRCSSAERMRDTAGQRQSEEQNRLLYVAMTRAEDRLIVCGWRSRRDLLPACWYEMVRKGFERLAATAAPFSPGFDPSRPDAAMPASWGDAMSIESPQSAPPDRVAAVRRAAPEVALPVWAGGAPTWSPVLPPREPVLPQPLAPSRPDHVTLAPVPWAASPLADRDPSGLRFRRGLLVHKLLQHLPNVPVAQRGAALGRMLDGLGSDMTSGEASSLSAEVLAVLDHELLAPLFGPDGRAEAPLTGVVNGVAIGGVIDRLAVLPGRVLIADYKTNRAAPARIEDTPVLYLRQMASYRALLTRIFAGSAVTCALVWTARARVSVLPDSLLDSHAPGVAG